MMRRLARQLHLIALAAVCVALLPAPRPRPVRRLWQVWPLLHTRRGACWRCHRRYWGEDLSVERHRLFGDLTVCDACLAREVPV